MPSFSCYTILLFKSCGWREQNFNPHLAQNCQSMAILKRDELRSALLLFWTYLQTTHFLMPSTLGGLCKHSPLCYALKSSATISLSTKSWFNTYCYWYFLSRRHQFLQFSTPICWHRWPLKECSPRAAGKPICCCFSFFSTCSLSGLHLLHSVLEGWHTLCFFPLHLLFLFHTGEGQRWCHKLRGQGREDRSAVTVVFKHSETQPQSQQMSAALKVVHPPLPKSISPGPSDLSIIKQLLNSLTPLEVHISWSKIS